MDFLLFLPIYISGTHDKKNNIESDNMTLINALNTGILGIQRGLADVQRNASNIASTDTMTADNASNLAESMVGLMSARTQVEASARVVETVNETLGTIIDVMV